MPSKELSVLLYRSAREPEQKQAVAAFEPFLKAGLLDLLSMPRNLRDDRIKALEKVVDSSPEVIRANIHTFDKELRLRPSERFHWSELSEAGSTPVESTWKRYRWVMLTGGALLMASVGLAIGMQLHRTQSEIARQQKTTDQQRKDIEQLKQKLADEQQRTAEAEVVASSASTGSTLPPTPSIPRSTTNVPSTRLDRNTDPRTAGSSASPHSMSSSLKWDGCEVSLAGATRPIPGQIWWPVVAPPSALESVRQHCRADAFLNGAGNVQIASFPDRDQAERWASRASSDSQHPYRFWIGEATVYGASQ